MRKTPLHSFHEHHGGRLVDFEGWSLPVQYTSILEEHRAVRAAAGLFDASHMGEARVGGAQAAAYLEAVCTNRMENLAVGKARYTLFCNEKGGCLDDCIVTRLAEEQFLLVLNASNTAKDLKWLQEQAKGFDCRVDDVSDGYALLALQGPKAEAILGKLVARPLDALGRFCVADLTIAGASVLLSRTGYTGEDGFEILCAPEEAEGLAGEILGAGQPEGLQLCGLGARDSLRLEAGLPLYGHEMDETVTPLEAGLGWAVKLDKKANFPGRDALRKEAESGPQRTLVHFLLEGRRIARPGTPVLQKGEAVGAVVSGTLSPILNRAMGSALVASEAAAAGNLEVDLRGKHIALEAKKPPLHK